MAWHVDLRGFPARLVEGKGCSKVQIVSCPFDVFQKLISPYKIRIAHLWQYSQSILKFVTVYCARVTCGVHTCRDIHVEVRRQLCGLGALLLLHGFPGSHSGLPLCMAGASSEVSFCWPNTHNLFLPLFTRQEKCKRTSPAQFNKTALACPKGRFLTLVARLLEQNYSELQ